MKHNPRVYLWDAKEAAEAITSFIAGKTFEDYSADLMLRSAVERQFEIIGEALNQLLKTDATLSQRIPDIRNIIDFRNLLIHGYTGINPALVWRIAHESLPILRSTVTNLLDELGPP